MTKSLKNVKNEKCTLKDLEYGEKNENHQLIQVSPPKATVNGMTRSETSFTTILKMTPVGNR